MSCWEKKGGGLCAESTLKRGPFGLVNLAFRHVKYQSMHGAQTSFVLKIGKESGIHTVSFPFVKTNYYNPQWHKEQIWIDLIIKFPVMLEQQNTESSNSNWQKMFKFFLLLFYFSPCLRCVSLICAFALSASLFSMKERGLVVWKKRVPVTLHVWRRNHSPIACAMTPCSILR